MKITAIEIRYMILRDFGHDLPIRGGSGGSLDDALVIDRVRDSQASDVEYFILDCLGLGRGINWKILEQALLKHEGRWIDKVTIRTEEKTATEIITQVENYYFDVTAFFLK